MTLIWAGGTGKTRLALRVGTELLAWITAGQQRHRRAATLLGAADALWTDVGA